MTESSVRDQCRQILLEKIVPMFANKGLDEMRAALDVIGKESEMPTTTVVKKTTIAGLSAEWLIPRKYDSQVLLYLHGGGFTMGSCLSHRSLAAQIGEVCQARTVLPEYRLAPEHPFPAGLEDAVAVYEALLDDGIQPSDILIAGDSSGGGLAVSTALAARRRGLPMPHGLVLLSPWTDLTLSGESMQGRADLDPWLDPKQSELIRDLYLGDADPHDPLASPLWGDLAGLPPLLIQVGEHEILFSDAERLATRAAAAGVPVRFEVGEKLWHVWQLFAPLLPEANEALERIASFASADFAHVQACG